MRNAFPDPPCSRCLLPSLSPRPQRRIIRKRRKRRPTGFKSIFTMPERGGIIRSFPANPKELPYDFHVGERRRLLDAGRRGLTITRPSTCRSWTRSVKGLDAYYWDPQSPVPAYNAYCSGPGGTDKYYDDNEWMVLTFAEAYEITHDPCVPDRRRANREVRPERLGRRAGRRHLLETRSQVQKHLLEWTGGGGRFAALRADRRQIAARLGTQEFMTGRTPT